MFSIKTIAQEREIENILEGNEEYSDVSHLLELLSELENNPLDLNTVTAKQLSILPWISDVVAKDITNYRKRFGNFSSIEELKKFSQIDPEIFPFLQKYISVIPPKKQQDISINFKTRVGKKLEQSEGLKNGYYYPSPEKIYNRFLGKYGEYYKLGILLEKDSGENKINDLTSYFIKYSNKNNGNEFIFGNYFLECGQGLIFWNPYGTRKSSNPIYSAKKQPRNAHEYTLVDENASLFGVTGTLNLNFINVLLFYSSNKVDASANGENGNITSFYSSGFHRNDNEKQKKDLVTEQLAGIRLELKPKHNLSIGLTAYQNQYNKDLTNENLIRNRYSFVGNTNNLVGLDYNLTSGFFNFFGEFARSRNNGYGMLTGLLMDSKIVKLTLSCRNYRKDFISLHGTSFSESGGNPQNEQGFYFGLKISPLKNLRISFYFDRFKFPWRTYLIPMPSNGKDLFFSFRYKPVKNLWLYLQFKSKEKDNIVTAFNEASLEKKIIIPKNQIKVRFQVDYQLAKKIKLRQRFEKCWIAYDKYSNFVSDINRKYSGNILFQDIQYQLTHKANLSYRIIFFDTDSYEARLYEFERDVPGIMTNQLLYGKGTRWYIFAQWKINYLFRLSLKYSSTHYCFTESIGSQYDKIVGDSIHTINFQVETQL